MRIALAQINNTVGDLDANCLKIVDFAKRAEAKGADVVVFPELALSGYPPRDLVEKESFLDRTEAALQKLACDTAAFKTTLIVGYVSKSPQHSAIKAQNSAAVICGGKVIFKQTKMLLPNYDVFDEARYFEPGETQDIVEIAGRRVALAICEDAWNDKQFWERRRYSRDPIEELVARGAEIIITNQMVGMIFARTVIGVKDDEVFVERFGQSHQFTGGGHGEAGAIEDQLVVAADHMNVDDG